jgi:hypothetical protein
MATVRNRVEENSESPSQILSREQGSSGKMANSVDSPLEFYRLMMALVADVLQGNITPSVCGAASNAAGRALKVLELQYRMGNKRMMELLEVNSKIE